MKILVAINGKFKTQLDAHTICGEIIAVTADGFVGVVSGKAIGDALVISPGITIQHLEKIMLSYVTRGMQLESLEDLCTHEKKAHDLAYSNILIASQHREGTVICRNKDGCFLRGKA